MSCVTDVGGSFKEAMRFSCSYVLKIKEEKNLTEKGKRESDGENSEETRGKSVEKSGLESDYLDNGLRGGQAWAGRESTGRHGKSVNGARKY